MAYRIAESLAKLRSQTNVRFPGRNKKSDGWIGDAAHASSNSDHNPHVKDGSMGVVTAIDITHDPATGCDAGLLADVLIASRDPRIKYIIWNRRIISGEKGPSPWTRRTYAGKSPHNMHVHISVNGTKAFYDDTSAWAIPGAAVPATPSAPPPPPAAIERRTLKLGSRGEDVRYLQKLLGITVDGKFEEETDMAVRKAQAKHKLEPDGKVGTYTWAALTK